MLAGIQRATRESWGCDENVDGALFVGSSHLREQGVQAG